MKKWTFSVLLIIVCSALTYYFYPEPELPKGVTIDKLIVFKSDRIMQAYSNGILVKTYTISLGKNPSGDKQFQGDKRTPEGEYRIKDRNPNSAYHKNLGVSYPNAADINEAKSKGLDPGGEIKIHGLRNGIGFIGKFHRIMNWTAGCIAVTNNEIDELYASVKAGAPIIIKP